MKIGGQQFSTHLTGNQNGHLARCQIKEQLCLRNSSSCNNVLNQDKMNILNNEIMLIHRKLA